MARKTEKKVNELKAEPVQLEYWHRMSGSHTTGNGKTRKEYAKGQPIPFPLGLGPVDDDGNAKPDWARTGKGGAAQPPEKAAQDAPRAHELRVVPRDAGWYDVVNTETGDKVNDAALRLDAAEAMAGAIYETPPSEQVEPAPPNASDGDEAETLTLDQMG